VWRGQRRCAGPTCSNDPIADLPCQPLSPQMRSALSTQILTQQDAPRQYPFSVKVSNVELFPYLFWGTIGTAVIWATRAMWQRAEESNRRGGRWVYDRSLGGKKVRGEGGARITIAQNPSARPSPPLSPLGLV
jgi:hypothetical protein